MKAVEKKIMTRHGAISLSDTEGPGVPVLFLHGPGGCRKVFERQCRPHLLEKMRIIAPDLPGHGQSDDADDPDAAYTISGLSETMEDVLDGLCIDNAAILGWSLGGHLAMELLARNPTVSGLFLVGAPPVSNGLMGMLRAFQPTFNLRLATRPKWLERDARRVEELCLGHSATPELRQAMERADGQLRATFARSLLRRHGHDERRTVLETSAPVFMAVGSEDPFVRIPYLLSFNDPDRERRVEVIDGGGHAVFREQPEPFNALLEQFVDVVAQRLGLDQASFAEAC